MSSNHLGLRHGRRNRSRKYRSCGTNVEAKVMNFIISDPACAGSAQHLVPSRAACMLRVRNKMLRVGGCCIAVVFLRKWFLILS